MSLAVTERVCTRQQAEALQSEVLAAAQRQAQEREAFRAVLPEACTASNTTSSSAPITSPTSPARPADGLADARSHDCLGLVT